jgi:hypothetical protein
LLHGHSPKILQWIGVRPPRIAANATVAVNLTHRSTLSVFSSVWLMTERPTDFVRMCFLTHQPVCAGTRTPTSKVALPLSIGNASRSGSVALTHSRVDRLVMGFRADRHAVHSLRRMHGMPLQCASSRHHADFIQEIDGSLNLRVAWAATRANH